MTEDNFIKFPIIAEKENRENEDLGIEEEGEQQESYLRIPKHYFRNMLMFWFPYFDEKKGEVVKLEFHNGAQVELNINADDFLIEIEDV